ncbi:MAG: hypothetical protein U1F77_17515 [Kiritimatiellia bacterium]
MAPRLRGSDESSALRLQEQLARVVEETRAGEVERGVDAGLQIVRGLAAGHPEGERVERILLQRFLQQGYRPPARWRSTRTISTRAPLFWVFMRSERSR